MKKKIAIAVLIVLGLPIAFIGFVLYSLPDLCGNDIYSVVVSPNKEYKAVVFQRDCGATTGFSTQISVLETNLDLDNSGGNIFVIDGHPDTVAPKLEWKSDNELVVHHIINGNEHKAATKVGWFNKISISYKPSSS